MVSINAVIRIMSVPSEELEVTSDVGCKAGLAVEPQLLLVLALVHGAADDTIVFGGALNSASATVPLNADGQAGIGDWEECPKKGNEEVELHSRGLGG